MREIMALEALREAFREEMLNDKRVVLIGEDIGSKWHGAFKVTQGLAAEFGEERVRDTPISEAAIIGTAVGAAMTGLRPVAEIMFGDLIALAMDGICNQAAKIRYMFGGQVKVPVVIRTPFGGGKSIAAHHSSSFEAWFMHAAGLKVAMPSTPYDSKGLLKTAIRNIDDPVCFFEHKLCYLLKGPVPEEEYFIPFGEADVKREGDDVTIVATFLMVHKSLKVAEELAKEGISVEVIDPRTLVPLDIDTIINSVKKTGRVIVVSEDIKRAGITAEIASQIMEEGGFDYLDAPIKRVASLNTPIPFSPPLEDYVIPNEKRITKAVKEILA
jgi:pyruvate/2-oxoglutarate/acetoin dehydrogenase E1 component